MGKKVKKFWNDVSYSSSKWEKSFFGGYYNLISDHPEVQFPYSLDLDIKNNMGLSWWTSEKLMKIFLLKVREHSLYQKLAQEAKPTKKTKFFMTKEVLMVQQSSLEEVMDTICQVEIEHKSLFIHYKDLIVTSEISIPMPPPSKSNSEDGEDEDNKKSKGKSKPEKGKGSPKSGSGESEEDKNEEGEDTGEGKSGENENNKKEGKGSGGGDPQDDEKEEEEEDGNGSGEGDSEEKDEGEGEGSKGEGAKGNGGSSRNSDLNGNQRGNGQDDGTRNSDRTEGKLTGRPGGREEDIKRKKGELEGFLGTIKKREIHSAFLNGNLVKDTRFIHPRDRNKCKFSENEYAYASRLVKLLDINFDPAVDRVNSLRTGKLDTRKLAEVIPGNMNVYYKHEENQTTKPFSVVILQDESGSMSEHYKIDYSKSILKTLYLAFSEILPQDKIYVYGHSGDVTPDIFVYQDKYNQKFEERIECIDARDQNYDGPAIEAVYDKVRAQTSDNIIFITLSDGQPCGSSYGGDEAKVAMKKVMEKCRRDGFVTVGLGILHFNDPNLYNYSCVIQSLGDEMIKKTSHIINKVVKTEFQ